MTTVYTATGYSGASTKMQLSVLRSPVHTIVTLCGDLDVATAPALRERLLAVLRPGMRLLVLDLSRVWFCDAAGAAVLVGIQRRGTRLGITIRLAAPRSRVAKVLRVTGLDLRLTILSTLSAALTRPLPPPLSRPLAQDGAKGARRPVPRPAARTGLANPGRTRVGTGDLDQLEIVAVR